MARRRSPTGSGRGPGAPAGPGPGTADGDGEVLEAISRAPTDLQRGAGHRSREARAPVRRPERASQPGRGHGPPQRRLVGKPETTTRAGRNWQTSARSQARWWPGTRQEPGQQAVAGTAGP